MPTFVNILEDSQTLYFFEKYTAFIHLWNQKKYNCDMEQLDFSFD